MVTQNRHPRPFDRLLAELAALWGVQTVYRDGTGRLRQSPPESVFEVLQALGALPGGRVPGDSDKVSGGATGDVYLRRAIDSAKVARAGRMIDPVIVAWDGMMPAVPLSSAAASTLSASERPVKLTLLLEDGEERCWEILSERSRVGAAELATGRARRLRVPLGYHRLVVETGDGIAEATVISAPRQCWQPRQLGLSAVGGGGREAPGALAGSAGEPDHPWGIFAPLYALRSGRDWGAGDLAELRELLGLVGDAGGSAVATLPLLANFLDRPFEPCPYRPVSRLFWNELYLAVEEISEWREDPSARRIWDEAAAQGEIARLRDEPLVDYQGVFALKRRVLESLSRCFLTRAGSTRRDAFAAYLRAHPDALEYAVFRARIEVIGSDWRSLPVHEIGEVAEPKPLSALSDPEAYHLYCQWQMDEQIAKLAGRGEAAGESGAPEGARPRIFLDLPVGVHPGGFDTWKWRDSFVQTMSVGAPPDVYFPSGQNWDFPPLDPRRAREEGHRYFARCLQTHARYAGYLRVDHVMALHRLFWIPEGRGPEEGVYVPYPADELYGVLCLESYKHSTVMVGEDLGTVPVGVRAAMRRRGVLGTWVLQGSLRPRAESPVQTVRRHTVATLGTHDMFPFAAFVRGDDIAARAKSGRLSPERARAEARARSLSVKRLADLPSGHDGMAERGMLSAAEAVASSPAEVSAARLLRRVIAFLLRSDAALVLINLEDLLLETRPQNRPGTGLDHGNWEGKAKVTIADVRRSILPED